MSIVRTAKRLLSALGTLCFPPYCAECRVATEPGVYLCDRCASKALRIEAPFCERCSNPFDGAITQRFVCSNCAGREIHFECAVALYRSFGVVRDFIHAFKYQRQLHLRRPLADWLAEALDDPRIAARPFDALVPVPLHHLRFREREFNQAEELARLLSQRAGIPMWHALKRIRYTTTQTKLDRNERMENLRGAFKVRHNAEVKNRHIVLVDDVFTTGSTVEECSRVLLRAGAVSVRVVTVARG